MNNILVPSAKNHAMIKTVNSFVATTFQGISFTSPELKEVKEKRFKECVFQNCVFDSHAFMKNELIDCVFIDCLIYTKDSDEDLGETLSGIHRRFRKVNLVVNGMMDGVLVNSLKKDINEWTPLTLS